MQKIQHGSGATETVLTPEDKAHLQTVETLKKNKIKKGSDLTDVQAKDLLLLIAKKLQIL